SYFTREYCPLERVLSYAASITAAIGVAMAISIMIVYGGFDRALEKLTAEFVPIAESLLSLAPSPPSVTAPRLAKKLVLEAAPAAAGFILILMMINLWLSGRVVQFSGQLPRPWPDIASELKLPRNYLLVFCAATIFGLYFGGIAGLIARIVAATVGVAFALVGLAVVHHITRGLSFRIPLLILVYLLLAITSPLPLLLIGVVETIFSLRDRKAKRAPPTK